MSRETVGRRLSRFLARTVATRVATARNAAPLVSFTFDDVHATAATEGGALLERHGARGTFYVAGGLIGTTVPDRQAASLEQCAALHRRGHEIGCHSFSHRPVASHGTSALAADLARNRAVFDATGERIALRNFAYPFNATSLAAKRQLERLFTTCRGGVPGINAGRVDLGFLRAVELHDNGIDAAGARAWVEEAVRRVGWLIFFSHGVRDEAEPWRCTPRLLESAVTAALGAGCDVLTVDAATERMGFRLDHGAAA